MGRYIPDTAKQQEVMLKQIGLNKIDDLYSMVPEEVRLKELDIPEGKSEYEVLEDITPPADSIPFSEAAVMNSLMDKIAAKCRTHPKADEPPKTKADSLIERLNLMKNWR